MAALNELNEILNERIQIGIAQRDDRFTAPSYEHMGYYETLGTNGSRQPHHLGFNHPLEQETANFNRDDWHNAQFRSVSSRNNVRAETKNSANSRLSTVHQAHYGENKSSPFT
jgi:hypothetical protein